MLPLQTLKWWKCGKRGPAMWMGTWYGVPLHLSVEPVANSPTCLALRRVLSLQRTARQARDYEGGADKHVQRPGTPRGVIRGL